jgi:uncharacterized Rossmann fold enzyme
LIVINRHNAPPPNAVPLQINCTTNVDLSEMYRHCRIAMRSGYPILQERGLITFRPVVIVGDSPDVVEHIDKISALKESGAKITAVKRAHDLLIAKGVIPDAAVACDAQASAVDIFKLRRPGITYYLGSICHPDMWSLMRGYSVVIWHPKIDGQQDALPEWDGVKKVYGGNTTGLRAISLEYILGHRFQTLVGFQSCVSSNGQMRASGGKVLAHDEAFPVNYAGRWFWTTASLAQQVNDLMPTLQMCPGIKIDAIGDGALPHVLKSGKVAGWPV